MCMGFWFFAVSVRNVAVLSGFQWLAYVVAMISGLCRIHVLCCDVSRSLSMCVGVYHHAWRTASFFTTCSASTGRATDGLGIKCCGFMSMSVGVSMWVCMCVMENLAKSLFLTRYLMYYASVYCLLFISYYYSLNSTREKLWESLCSW